MRSLFLSAVMLVTAFAAQAQQSYGIAYQAVARDADGDALENATLDVRFTLTNAAEAAVWTETHNGIMTDAFGLINLTIGSVEGGEGLASVDWAAGGFAFQVEVNSGGGFETFGSMAVTSVPVSLYAASAPEPKADSLAAVTAQEAMDRANADAGLQGQIDGNDADIATNAGAISTNATAISDEVAARASADAGLQGQIDGNTTDILANAGAISDEVAARASADTGLQGQIDGNDTDIAANAGAISSNATAISDEASARASADAGLQGQIDANDTDIATNAGAISTNATAISDESGARASADSGLQGQIDGNDTDILANAGAISTNATAISDEASARAAGDVTLQDNIDTESQARFTNDSFLSGMISANSVADAALDARVTALEGQSSAAAVNAIDSLDTAHSAEILANSTALSSETSARIAADEDLEGQIEANDTDITANADAISSEVTARAAADADLQDQINNLPSSVPTISNIVEDMLDPTQIGAGLAFDGSYYTNTATNYIGTAISLVSADELLDAAVKAVQDDVDANELASDDAEAALDLRLDALEADPTTGASVAAVQTDVDQNEADADAADAALDLRLDALEADPTTGAAVTAVQTDVDQNEADADAADAALDLRLDALEADPTTGAAVTAIQNDVDQNEADADAAIFAVQQDVDQNESDADAAILAVQQDVDANELASDNAEAALQTELDDTQASTGLGADGAYTANAATNYIAAAMSLVGADEALDAQAKANADEIAATDYFDQTDVTLHAGSGETWTGIETANGSFTTGVSTGTMDASGNATVGGTLDVTGAATLGSTLHVTGDAEVDGELGVSGNVRVGASGATKFSIDATTGAVTTAGDVIALTGGIAAGSVTVTGTSTLQSVSASSLSVSDLLTVPSPSLGSAAANKSYVDGAISTAMATPQAYSYLSSGTYTGLGADLGAAAVTVTVTGANLAAGTYKLHLDGNEATLTVTVNSATEIEFDITDADVSALTSRTGLLAAQLSIDGKSTGLSLFLNL